LQKIDPAANHAALELNQAPVERDAASRPKAPSRPMFAVSIVEPFSSTVKSESTAPSGK
jgi:hypothetical protein